MGRPVRKGRKRKPRGGLARSYGAAVGLDRRVQFFRKIARFMRKGFALTVINLFLRALPAPINKTPAPAQLFCFSACLVGTVAVGEIGLMSFNLGRKNPRAARSYSPTAATDIGKLGYSLPFFRLRKSAWQEKGSPFGLPLRKTTRTLFWGVFGVYS